MTSLLRINAPLGSAAELPALAEAGANEIYCGIVPEGMSRKDEGAFLNRRPTREGNLSSFDALRDAVATAHAKGLHVSFTLNEPFSPDDHYPHLLGQAEAAVEAGVDALIVADPVLMKHLHDRRLPVRIHVSVAASCLNSAAVAFFRSLGAARIILPRHLRFAEIAAMVRRHPDLEFEVIVLGDPCPWDDGMCTMEHNLHHFRPERPFTGGLCSVLCQDVTVHGEIDEVQKEAVRRRHTEQIHRVSGCGLCALRDLRAIGVTHVKSTGRDNALLRLRFVRYLALALSLLEDEALTREAFMQLARDLRARMFADFVAAGVVDLAGRIPSPTRLGTAVHEVLAQARLLGCDPPFGCYFPEAVIDDRPQVNASSSPPS